ncbi:MAG: two-component system response regulator MprA, partial [Ilumatobacter sp.]
ELLARVRALLRRTDHSDSVTLRCGDLVLDPAKHLVTRTGDAIELTRTEFEILHTLMTNAEIVLSRSQLYETIWGYDFETNSKSLDVHIGYLRRKLEEGDRERLVHTVRGIGYVVRSGESNT